MEDRSAVPAGAPTAVGGAQPVGAQSIGTQPVEAHPVGAHPVGARPVGTAARGSALPVAGAGPAEPAEPGSPADPVLDRLARRVCAALDVPVALVARDRADRQLLPGLSGLPEPWASRRHTPADRSLCRLLGGGAPLVVAHVRDDPRLHGHPAAAELGLHSLVVLPLSERDGRVTAVLCAADTRPRRWTTDELDTLADLAAIGRAELELRRATAVAERERRRSRELEELLRAALLRTQLLLTASQVLGDAAGAVEIRQRLAELLATDLRPSYVELVLADGDGRVHPVADHRPDGPADPERPSSSTSPAPSTGPAGASAWDRSVAVALAGPAAGQRRLFHYPDRAALDDEFGPRAADGPAPGSARYRRLGLRALTAVPALDAGEPAGVLLVGWDRPRPADLQEHALLGTLAGYAAQGLRRTGGPTPRTGTAHRVHAAVFAGLPAVDGLRMAARHLPADTGELIGGDWYDVLAVPDPTFGPAGTPAPGAAGATVLAVGDLAGRTGTAAVIGQLRAMLRQAAWERRGGPPSTLLGSVEAACAALGTTVLGTALVAQLRPVADGTGRWTLTWTNAGHPGPLLLRRDGGTALLDEHDVLFGRPELRAGPRRNHHRLLDPGDTLVLYTDGLVRRRGGDVDDGIAALRALLAGLGGMGGLGGTSPLQIVEAAVPALAGSTPDDDVVVLAVQVLDAQD